MNAYEYVIVPVAQMPRALHTAWAFLLFRIFEEGIPEPWSSIRATFEVPPFFMSKPEVKIEKCYSWKLLIT